MTKRGQTPARKSGKGELEKSDTRDRIEDLETGIGTRSDRRRRPRVDPGFVTLNHEGFGWRAWMVRLPQTAIADDLKEPGLWESVQAGNLAFRRHDHLYIVAHDESWAAEAVVTDASREAAVISKPRIMAFETKIRQLFEDEKYRIKWFGNGFAVERKADGLRVSELVPNEALAERDLVRLHPRPG